MKSDLAKVMAAAGATVLALGAAGASWAQAGGTADAAKSWAEMQKCASIADDQARHACTDEVLRKAGLSPSPQARSEARRKSFGLETPKVSHSPPKPLRVEQAAAPPAKAARSKPAAPVDDDRRVSVILQHVVLRGDGKFELTTAEGAVWAQSDSDAVRPTPTSGQSMQIDRTALGGFMCHTARWTAFRCHRER